METKEKSPLQAGDMSDWAFEKSCLQARASIILKRWAVWITTIFLLVACRGENQTRPQFFTFNFNSIESQNADILIADIDNGTTPFSYGFEDRACNFTLDFNPVGIEGIPPAKSVTGQPGVAGFNMSFAASPSISIPISTNPEDCERVRSFRLAVGSRTDAVNLNEPTHLGSFSINIDGLGDFPDDEYSSFTITGFNDSTRQVSGTFESLRRNRSVNRNLLLFIEGSFSFSER